MVSGRQRRFLLAQLWAMLLVIAALASLTALEADIVVSLSFVCLLIVTALTAPVHAMPPWRRRLRPVLYVGGGVFLVLIGYRTALTLLRAF